MTDTLDTARENVVGQPMRRKEDARLVTGRTNWTDNIAIPGLLYMAILRSPMAHARITRIDVTPALAKPGVVAAFSGKELGDKLSSMPCVWPVTDDIKIPAHPPLATEEVRFVGDAVAVVIAGDRYLAADALEAIEVDYEPLPPVLDMRAALADGADLVHTELGTNKSYVWKLGGGDYEAAKAKAARVFTRHYVNQRLIPMAMEPRAVVAAPTGAEGELTLWTSTQIPHIVRVLLALSGQRGFGLETLADALIAATPWSAAAATVLATVYLFWRSLAERLLTLRSASGVLLVSAAFGVAWVTVLRAAGVQFAPMPATDAVWMLSPMLLPLLVSVLAPWSLSRVRHT